MRIWPDDHDAALVVARPGFDVVTSAPNDTVGSGSVVPAPSTPPWGCRQRCPGSVFDAVRLTYAAGMDAVGEPNGLRDEHLVGRRHRTGLMKPDEGAFLGYVMGDDATV